MSVEDFLYLRLFCAVSFLLLTYCSTIYCTLNTAVLGFWYDVFDGFMSCFFGVAWLALVLEVVICVFFFLVNPSVVVYSFPLSVLTYFACNFCCSMCSVGSKISSSLGDTVTTSNSKVVLKESYKTARYPCRWGKNHQTDVTQAVFMHSGNENTQGVRASEDSFFFMGTVMRTKPWKKKNSLYEAMICN